MFNTKAMDETDELQELQRIQQKQVELGQNILNRILLYHYSSNEDDVIEFLNQVEFIFDKWSYTDEIRLDKIADKMDLTMKTLCFYFGRRSGTTIPNDGCDRFG